MFSVALHQSGTMTRPIAVWHADGPHNLTEAQARAVQEVVTDAIKRDFYGKRLNYVLEEAVRLVKTL